MRRALSCLAAALVLGVSACTTVPSTSSPQIIHQVPVGSPRTAVEAPPKGADARTIVEDFLDRNAIDEPDHASARQYLTPGEHSRWNDATVTVVDKTQVQNLTLGRPLPAGQRRGTINVTGQPVGTIDPNGVYTPALRGDGSGIGGVPVTQTFSMVQINGQWRIDNLPPGLLITSAQFAQFRQFAVYYLDSSETSLVPQPRYTQLTGTSQVVSWLMDELAQVPPVASLQSLLALQGAKTVTTTVPSDPSDPSTPIVIQIPGASVLGATNLNRLGAQIGATLKQVLQVDRVQITDGGTPVRIPATSGTTFTTEEVSALLQPVTPPNQLYYVYEGGVYDEVGHRVPGKAGAGVYDLTSVAITVRPPSTTLLIAGVRGHVGDETLDIPDPRGHGGLIATTVHGTLSRPSWAPGKYEVWIGDGSSLVRVTGAKAAQPVPLDLAGGETSGRVSAVRISPDGTRVALVLTSAGRSQVYVGNIVRSAGQVRVEGLQPISPFGVQVTDVAWNDQLKLFAVGHDVNSGEDGVYEVQCDGSLWTPGGELGLPEAPDSVTATAFSLAVVSSGQSVWQQQGVGWQGLVGGGQTLGTNPIYLE